MAQEQAPTPREAINGFVDSAFTDLRPQFERYTQDERRVRTGGGVNVKPFETVTFNDDHSLGLATIKAVRRSLSIAPMYNAFREMPAIAKLAAAQEEAGAYTGDNRPTLVSLDFAMMLARQEVLGKGRTWHDTEGFSSFIEGSPRKGLARDLGVTMTAFMHSAQGSPMVSKISVSLLSRFDIDPPRFKCESITVSDDERSVIVGHDEDGEPITKDTHTYKHARPAETGDLEGVAAVFEAGRDRRIIPSTIREYLAYIEEQNAEYADVKGMDRFGGAANVFLNLADAS